MNTLFSILHTFRRLFLDPPPSVTAPDQRRHARFIAAMMLFVFIFGFVVEFVLEPFFGGEVINSSFYDPNTITTSSFITIGFAALAYLLARTRYFRLGALLFIFAFSAIIFWLQISRPGLDSFFLLPYLLVPVVILSIFGGLRITTLFTVGNLVILFVVLNLLNPQYPQLSVNGNVIQFYIFLAIILVISVEHRDTLERDRRRTLVESEERYKTLSETVFEGIALVRNGQIISVNPGFPRIFDYDDNQVEKNSLLLFMPDLNLASPDVNTDAYLGETPLVETTGLRRNGDYIELEVIINEHSQDSERLHMLAVRDVTERNRIQEALLRAQRLDSIGVMAGGIAHDFNNMLAAISAQVSLAQSKLPRDNGLHIHMEKAIESVRSASDLARQLLVYAGKGEFEKQIVDLNQIVEHTLSLVKDSLPSHVRLSFHKADSPLTITADSSQIQQVILNLVVNAGQAMQSAGEVTVSTSQTALNDPLDIARFISRRQPTPGRYASLIVCDTGEGISPAARDHIFDPFFTTKESGTGLGLAATLGVVQAHEGAIALQSEEGKGTEFEVVFPLEDTQILETRQVSFASTPQVDKKMPVVLVIDDEEVVRESTVEILELFDYRVLAARDGHEGVECYRQHREEVDLTILDMNMPGMNGEETLDVLQSIDADLKVLMSTGYNGEQTLGHLFREGTVGLLQKPYDLDTLVDTARQMLNGSLSR